MRDYLTPILFFQRFLLPGLLVLVIWSVWRTFWRRDLAVGLVLYIGLVIIADGFLNTGIFLPGMEKGSIRYSEVCAAFLLFSRPSFTPRRPPYGAICVFVSLYFLLLFSSTFRSDSLVGGLFEFRRIIIPQIIALLIAKRGFRSPADFRRFFFGLMGLAILLAVFVFFDLFFDRWLIDAPALYSPEYGMNRRVGRYGSFFINPNFLGAFVVLIFAWAFMATVNEESGKGKLLGAIGILSLVFCLVETQSRGPLISFGTALPLLLLGPAGKVSRTRRLAMFLPLLAVIMLIMPGFYERASSRFDSLDQEMDSEVLSREAIWVYTRRVIADYPLSGIGFGEPQFSRTIQEYGFAERFGRAFDNPHNSYLQMTVYAGFPALTAFLLANIFLLVNAARSRNRRNHLAFGMAVGIAGFLVTIYPDMHMFTQTVAPVYWVFFGLLLAMTTARDEPSTLPDHPGSSGLPRGFGDRTNSTFVRKDHTSIVRSRK